jgi:hypothetical protein
MLQRAVRVISKPFWARRKESWTGLQQASDGHKDLNGWALQWRMDSRCRVAVQEVTP